MQCEEKGVWYGASPVGDDDEDALTESLQLTNLKLIIKDIKHRKIASSRKYQPSPNIKHLPQAPRKMSSSGKTLNSRYHVSIHTMRNDVNRSRYAILGKAACNSIKTNS